MVGVRNEHGLDNSQKWEVLKWGPMWYLDLKLLWESGRNTCCSSNSERIIFKKLEVVKWEPRWHHDTCMVGMGGKKEHRLDNSQKWEVLKWAPRWYLDTHRVGVGGTHIVLQIAGVGTRVISWYLRGSGGIEHIWKTYQSSIVWEWEGGQIILKKWEAVKWYFNLQIVGMGTQVGQSILKLK